MKVPAPLPRATAFAHHLLRESLRPGDLAIDATCGNGHDTIALAEMVGPDGRVLALDLQPNAVANTRDRCQSAGLADRVIALPGDHRDLTKHWNENFSDPFRPSAIIFNLGYLPGGDKSLITQSDSTLAGLDQARTLLAPGGLLICVCYPGHPGGDTEADAVRQWFAALPGDTWPSIAYEFLNQPAQPPFVLATGPRG